MLLDGKVVRDTIQEKLKGEIASFKTKPTLAILQIGSREDSNAYIKQKIQFAEKVGAEAIHKTFPETIDTDALIAEIQKLNADPHTHGIIVQIPFPEHLHKNDIIEAIDPKKDVDGLTALNVKKLFENDSSGFVPATTKGILTLLDHYKISLEGKRLAMIGRSTLVGKPTAIALINRNASVLICHRKTQNIPNITRNAEIIVVAAGHPHLITKEYVKPGQIVIDVGINLISGTKFEEEIPGKKFVGDVNFEEVKDIVEAISPVPGGVGPLTVASLFQNLVTAYKQQNLVG